MGHKNGTARQIGKGLAYIQDTIDVAVSWGFHKLRTTKIPEHQAEAGTGKAKAKKAANGFLRFFGELGESFYKEYDKLKSKRVHKDQ